VAIDRLRAEGFASAELASESLVGAKAHFEPAKEKGAATPAVEGVLRFVSPEIDPVSRQVRVWAEIDNHDLRMRPGQQGRMTLPAREEPANHANGRE
jgi:macrolide-specific efflux system membrane fusion protein